MIAYEGYGTGTGEAGTNIPVSPVPAGATGCVIAFFTGDDAGPHPDTTVTYGNEPCEFIGFDTSGGAVTSGASMWWCPDIRGATDDVIRYSGNVGAGSWAAHVLFFSAIIPALRDTNAYTSAYNGGNSARYQSSDASVPVSGGNQMAVMFRYQWGASAMSAPASTLLWNGGTAGMSYDIGAADEAVSADLYATGGSFWGWYFGTTVYETSVIPNASPDPINPELAFNAGAIAFQGDIALRGGEMRALRFGFRPGRMGGEAGRQVALIMGDPHLKTPEATVDGDEGDLLTRHLTRPPTWEPPDAHVHSRRWVPMVWRPDPVGAPNTWEMLHADDGTPMMTWVED